MRRIPIHNRGNSPVQVGLEPEGDCIPLQPGGECEVHFDPADAPTGTPELEIEIEGSLISLYTAGRKQVFQSGQRIR